MACRLPTPPWVKEATGYLGYGHSTNPAAATHLRQLGHCKCQRLPDCVCSLFDHRLGHLHRALCMGRASANLSRHFAQDLAVETQGGMSGDMQSTCWAKCQLIVTCVQFGLCWPCTWGTTLGLGRGADATQYVSTLLPPTPANSFRRLASPTPT